MSRTLPLLDTTVIVTRPAGTGSALARRVRTQGGAPLLLPGSALRAPADAVAARAALTAALACSAAIFTSPAAVRFARKLAPLHGSATLIAPGSGTQRALARAGRADAIAPGREDSEGILGLPALGNVRNRRIGIVGAAGGRGLLDRTLGERGATVVHAIVYRRLPARLDRRHADALRAARATPRYVLISSAEALANLLAGLPEDATAVLLGSTAVVSSTRLATAAQTAGFARILTAGSPHAGPLLAAIAAARA